VEKIGASHCRQEWAADGFPVGGFNSKTNEAAAAPGGRELNHRAVQAVALRGRHKVVRKENSFKLFETASRVRIGLGKKSGRLGTMLGPRSRRLHTGVGRIAGE